MKFINWIKAVWNNLPHPVQAAIMLFAGAAAGTLGQAISTPNACLALHCWRDYLGISIKVGIGAVVALYIPANTKKN